MKQKRTSHYCMNKECGWKKTSHKVMDGIKCPRCKGLVISEVLNGVIGYGR